MSESTDYPEIDLLQQIAPLLREKVSAFKSILNNEYIDIKAEKQAQEAAARELNRLEEAKVLTENALSSKCNMEVLEKLQQALTAVLEKTRTDVVNYQRAKIVFDQRQDEYNQISPLRRQFMTPRTRFARAWASEEALSPRNHLIPEVNFIGIALGVFVLLVIVNFIYWSAKAYKVHTTFQTGVMAVKKCAGETDIKKCLKNALSKRLAKTLFDNITSFTNITSYIKTEL